MTTNDKAADYVRALDYARGLPADLDRETALTSAYLAGVAAERTACARIAWGMRADHHDANPEPTVGRCMCAQCELAFQIADAIRARGRAAT